jgi:hypothetical protein
MKQFRSSRAEAIKKYKFTFVIVRSFHRPSLCNGPRVSANAGRTVETQFWEPRLLQSANLLKFQGYPGNGVNVKKIDFILENKKKLQKAK